MCCEWQLGFTGNCGWATKLHPVFLIDSWWCPQSSDWSGSVRVAAYSSSLFSMDKQNGTQQTENKQSEFDRSTAKERIDRIDLYGFERSEDFDYDSHEEFMSVYLAILTKRLIKWSKLLKGNNKVVKNIKVKRYVRKGFPNVHRSLIWMAASGAQAQLEQNPGYYRKLLEGERDPRLEDTIKTDMHRTFPDNVHFRKNAEPCLQHTLFNVLLAYGHHNTNVGYCQGMNFIVGYLILIKKDEEKSFWLLDALLGRILPENLHSTW